MKHWKKSVAATGFAVVCMLSGCAEKDTASSSAALETTAGGVQSAEGITLYYDDTTIDTGYAEMISAYFTAVQNTDFATADSLVYSVYADALEAYLQEACGYGRDTSFQNMCDALQMDGYDGYTITSIQFEYEAEDSLDDYLTSMAELFGTDFGDNVRAGISEGHNILFSVNACYGTDTTPIAIIEDQELIVVKTTDGEYRLFG